MRPARLRTTPRPARASGVAGIAWIALARNAVDPVMLGTWVSLFLLSMLSMPLLYLRHRDLRSWQRGWDALIPWYAGCIVLHGLIWGVGLALILPVAPVLELQSLVLLLALLVGAPLSVSSHFITTPCWGCSASLARWTSARPSVTAPKATRTSGSAARPAVRPIARPTWRSQLPTVPRSRRS